MTKIIYKPTEGEQFGEWTAIKMVVIPYRTGSKRGYRRWLCINKEGLEYNFQESNLFKQCSEIEQLEKLRIHGEYLIKNNIHQPSVRNRYYREYLTNSITHNRIFNISFEVFNQMIIQNCFYCGKKPQSYDRWKKTYERCYEPPLEHNGIDRVDSNLGYTVENTVTCCTLCNRFKMEHSIEHFLNHVNQIYKFQNKIE